MFSCEFQASSNILFQFRTSGFRNAKEMIVQKESNRSRRFRPALYLGYLGINANRSPIGEKSNRQTRFSHRRGRWFHWKWTMKEEERCVRVGVQTDVEEIAAGKWNRHLPSIFLELVFERATKTCVWCNRTEAGNWKPHCTLPGTTFSSFWRSFPKRRGKIIFSPRF